MRKTVLGSCHFQCWVQGRRMFGTNEKVSLPQLMSLIIFENLFQSTENLHIPMISLLVSCTYMFLSREETNGCRT